MATHVWSRGVFCLFILLTSYLSKVARSAEAGLTGPANTLLITHYNNIVHSKIRQYYATILKNIS